MLQNLLSAPVTLGLLAINVALSLYALFQDQRLIDSLAFKPDRILRASEWHRMVSAAFIHGSVGHLAFNMITLFFFGPTMEFVLGPITFLIIYFGSLLVAHLIPLYRHRNSETYAAVGASGAISGLITAFAIYFPLEKIYLMFVPIGIPSIIAAIAFIGFSVYAMQSKSSNGLFTRVAHEAHLGGALGGMILAILLNPSVIGRLIGQITGALS